MNESDALAGLPSDGRLLDKEMLESVLQLWLDNERPSALVVVAVREYEPLLDELGEGADGLRDAVTARLRRAIRPSDAAADLGHGHFAVLAPEWPDEDALRTMAGRLEARLAEPLVIEGRRIELQAGTALSFSRGETDAESMLLHALASLGR